MKKILMAVLMCLGVASFASIADAGNKDWDNPFGECVNRGYLAFHIMRARQVGMTSEEAYTMAKEEIVDVDFNVIADIVSAAYEYPKIDSDNNYELELERKRFRDIILMQCLESGFN